MAKAKKKAAAKKAPAKRAQKEAKAETVDVNTMSLMLGNMPPPKDILYHLDTINGLQDKARTAAAKVSEAKKKAKEAGIDLKAIAEGLSMERMDPLDLATYVRQLQVIMREKGLPVQASFFDLKFGSVEEQAANEGWNDGRAGRHANVERWKEGIPGHKEYMRRWNDGQAELMAKGPVKAADDE